MSVTFRLLAPRNLILFRYSGQTRLHEPSEAVQASTRAPGYRPGMRHLVDLTHVTGVDRDWPALLRQQAQIAAALMPGGPEQLVLFLAPTRPGQVLAQMARRSWEGLDSIAIRVIEDEAEALALLGVPERSVAALLALDQHPLA
ncbi:MAG: hypothetical protein ACK4S2_06765 [Gemmobacter sp.]|uniref:hypothetical protein n=1 Tax=Gemmobacter sp. TaxID=1898957 RepID=UPI003918A433